MRKKTILLLSGGIDSYVAWHYLKKPKTVYFDLGTKYSEQEINVVKNLVPDTIIEQAPILGAREVGVNAFIPYRNIHLAMLANRYGNNIVMAGLKDDMVNDKSPEAFRLMSYFMSTIMNKPIFVTSPFWKMTKEEVVRWYLENVCDGSILLHSTLSCYQPIGKEPCWACPACLRKWIALKANDVDVPLFNDDELMLHYLDRARNKEFIPERNETTFRILFQYLFHGGRKT